MQINGDNRIGIDRMRRNECGTQNSKGGSPTPLDVSNYLFDAILHSEEIVYFLATTQFFFLVIEQTTSSSICNQYAGCFGVDRQHSLVGLSTST